MVSRIAVYVRLMFSLFSLLAGTLGVRRPWDLSISWIASCGRLYTISTVHISHIVSQAITLTRKQTN